MQIAIGENTLEVISAGARRLPSGKVLVVVEAKQELISHEDLRALFDGTTEDLIVTRDDGTKDTYGGCHYKVLVFDDWKKMVVDGLETDILIHRAEIECSSEAEFQLGRLRGTVDAQNVKIDAQNEQVGCLAEMSEAQLSAIDSILTEVVPAIIEMAVTQAIEAVTTEQTTDEASDVVE